MSSSTVLDTRATTVSPDRSSTEGSAGRTASGGWLMRQPGAQMASPVLRLCAVVSEVARNRRQS